MTADKRSPDDRPSPFGPGEEDDVDDLRQAVQRYKARRERWEQEGEWTLARTVALMRSLGWMIVLPSVLGVFAGRYLDTMLGGGVVWTIGLLAFGLLLGCWMAWSRVNKD